MVNDFKVIEKWINNSVECFVQILNSFIFLIKFNVSSPSSNLTYFYRDNVV